MITANILANAVPLNDLSTKAVSDLYPNYFVPAGFTFSIWSLIYFLLCGFMIVATNAVIKEKRGVMMDAIQSVLPLFWLSCILNASWIFAWHYLQVTLSVMIMICFLATLISIYARLQNYRHALSPSDKLWVYHPFIVYLGWISVATIANITAFLVSKNWSGFGLEPTAWTYIMITAAGLIGAYMVWIQREWAFSLVVVWAFFGIFKSELRKTEINSNYVLYALIFLAGITILRFLFRTTDHRNKKLSR